MGLSQVITVRQSHFCEHTYYSQDILWNYYREIKKF